jgi:hypothetical protein
MGHRTAWQKFRPVATTAEEIRHLIDAYSAQVARCSNAAGREVLASKIRELGKRLEVER